MRRKCVWSHPFHNNNSTKTYSGSFNEIDKKPILSSNTKHLVNQVSNPGQTFTSVLWKSKTGSIDGKIQFSYVIGWIHTFKICVCTPTWYFNYFLLCSQLNACVFATTIASVALGCFVFSRWGSMITRHSHHTWVITEGLTTLLCILMFPAAYHRWLSFSSACRSMVTEHSLATLI